MPERSLLLLVITFSSLIPLLFTSNVLCWIVKETDWLRIRVDKWFDPENDTKFYEVYNGDIIQQLLLPVPPAGYTVSSVYLKVSFFKAMDLHLYLTPYPNRLFKYRVISYYVKVKRAELIIKDGGGNVHVFTLWTNIYGYGSSGTFEEITSRDVVKRLWQTYPRSYEKTVKFGKPIYVLESYLKVVWSASFSLEIWWLDDRDGHLQGELQVPIHTAVISLSYEAPQLHTSRLHVCSWPISVPINGTGYLVFTSRFTNFTITRRGEYSGFNEKLVAPRRYGEYVFSYWILEGEGIVVDNSVEIAVRDNQEIKVVAIYCKEERADVVIIPGCHIPLALNISESYYMLHNVSDSVLTLVVKSSSKFIKMHRGGVLVDSVNMMVRSPIIHIPSGDIGIFAMLFDLNLTMSFHDYWRDRIGDREHLIIELHKDGLPIFLFNLSAKVDDVDFIIDAVLYNESGTELIIIPVFASNRRSIISGDSGVYWTKWYVDHIALSLGDLALRTMKKSLWPLREDGTIHVFLNYSTLREYMYGILAMDGTYINFSLVEVYGDIIMPIGLSSLKLELVEGMLVLKDISISADNVSLKCTMKIVPYNISLRGFSVLAKDFLGNIIGVWRDDDFDGLVEMNLRARRFVLSAYPPPSWNTEYIIVPSSDIIVKIEGNE